IAQEARLVDLTHQVPPQDLAAGAFLLWSAVESFPPGTVHLAVVDPGVGTARRAIALRAARGNLLVGPDSGLLLPAAERLGGVTGAVHCTRERFWGPARSATFHGRDLFGPVAAHLSRGLPLEELGPVVEDLDRSLSFPKPHQRGGVLVGEVLHVDGFGNLVTNLAAGVLPATFTVRVLETEIRGAPHPHFQAVPEHGLLALIGSAGLLEVCARDDSAARILGAKRGSPVEIAS
ncbi:MAG: SAM hydrolase/SAM-dependent halogenase family protein, partial [Myxococcaceae bacterium]